MVLHKLINILQIFMESAKSCLTTFMKLPKTVPIGGEGYPKKKVGLMSPDPNDRLFYTAYYNRNISVGSWDKKYEVTKQKVAA